MQEARFDTSNFFAQPLHPSSPTNGSFDLLGVQICDTADASIDDSMSPDDDLEFSCVLHDMYKSHQADSESFEGGDDAGEQGRMTMSDPSAFPLQFLLDSVVAPVQLAYIKPEADSSLFDSTSLSLSNDGQMWSHAHVAPKLEGHSNSGQYHSHPLRLSKSPPFTCPLPECGRKYRRKGDLKVHCVTKHPGMIALHRSISTPKSTKEGKAFPCPVESCRCGFKWERDLRRHIKGKHMPQREDSSRPPKAWARRPVEFNDLNMCRWKLGRR
jgi:hypothetical protein